VKDGVALAKDVRVSMNSLSKSLLLIPQ